MFLFSFVSVYAVNPHISIQSGKLLVVRPQIDEFKVNTNLELNFHIVNSNGTILNNSVFNCTAHVYNSKDEHILIQNLTSVSNGYDKQLSVNGSKLNSIGFYAVNVFCNSYQDEWGIDSFGFYITRDGFDYPTDINVTFLPSLIGILGIIFLLLFLYYKLDESHYILKTFIVCFTIFLAVIIPRVIFNYVFFDFSGDFLKYYMWFLRIFIIYLFGYFLWSVADYYGKTEWFKRFLKGNFGKKNG